MDDDRGGNSLLAALAHPQVLNPLAAYSDAARAANSIWANRQNQANQAAGQAYQGAIDAQGNFDPVKFRQNLAATGSTGALAAQSGVESAQRLAGEQIDQSVKVRNQIASMLAPLADPNLTPEQLHAGMMNVANQALDAGMPRQQVLSTLLNIPTDPEGRRAAIEQIRRSLLPPSDLQTVTYGRMGTELGPNGVRVPTVQNQQSGAYTQAPGGVQTGPSTETGEELVPTTVEVKNPDGSKTYQQISMPKKYLPGYGQPAGGGQSTGGGAPPPAPPKPGSAPIPGAYPGRNTSAPAGTPAPTPAPGAAPQPGSPVVTTPGGAPAFVTAPPQGQPDRLAAGNKLYTEASGAIPDQQKRLIAGESALEAMKLAATGPSTGYVAQAKAWLEARGETPDGTDGLSPAAARQVLQKQLLRFADNQSKAAGTDLRLETQMHSNANPDMLASANRHVLVQDIGILRRDMVMNKSMPQGEAALDHVKNFPTDTNPRGFAWDVMTKQEHDEAEADAKKTAGGMAKLDRSIELAHRHGVLKVPAANAK